MATANDRGAIKKVPNIEENAKKIGKDIINETKNKNSLFWKKYAPILLCGFNKQNLIPK